MRRLLFIIATCVALGIFTQTQASLITVSVEPSATIVNLGDTFSVSLLADIPDADPALGWGLDLGFDRGVLSHDPLTDVAVGLSWFAVDASDGDALASLAFPDPISGNGILLATLTFTASNTGTTALFPGITAGDFNEGFILLSGEFAELAFSQTHIAVVPEPATIILAGLSLCMCMTAFWRKRKT